MQKRRDLLEWRDFFPPLSERSEKPKRGLTIEEMRMKTKMHLAAQR